MQRVRTDNIDETNLHAPPGWQRRVLRLTSDPYGYAFDRLPLGDGLDVEHIRFLGAIHLDSALDCEALHVMFPYGSDVRIQGIRASENLTVITPPHHDFVATGFVQSGGLGIQVTGALLHELATASGAPIGGGRRSFLAGGLAAARLLRAALADVFDPRSFDAGLAPQARVNLRAEVLGHLGDLLSAIGPSRGDAMLGGGHRRQLAVVAARLIRERAGRTPTMPSRQRDLCRELGISARTLQLAFQESFGVGYRAFDRAVRLAEAHRQLCERSDDRSVTEIALSCGFWHLGRFAEYHRRVYGRSPSDVPGPRAWSVRLP